MRRRTLVIGGLLGVGALVVGYWFAHPRDRLGSRRTFPPGRNEAALNGWVRIADDGRVIVAAPRAEMGQGVQTMLAQLVADEMDARWQDMTVEAAPDDPVYRNVEILLESVPFSPEQSGPVPNAARWAAGRLAGVLGLSATGGSTSTRDAWLPLRYAGAAARAVLLQAAARRSGRPLDDLVTNQSAVYDREGEMVATYGELVRSAGAIDPPPRVVLKPRQQLQVVGRPMPRLDIPDKVRGAAVFGVDVRPPGLLYAAIRHCPVLGGTLKSVTEPSAGLPRGIRAVVQLRNAVAVIADSWWRAERLLADENTTSGLKIEWLPGPTATYDSAKLWAELDSLAATAEPDFSRRVARRAPGSPLIDPPRRIEATYRAPYLAHATMEPMNCTALVQPRRIELWLPTQSTSLARRVAARVGDVEVSEVTVNGTLLGGGFGRRAEMDVVREAVAIARTVPGTPIQLLWSREEDFGQDYYRPMALGLMACGIDAEGAIAEWRTRVIGQSASSQYARRNLRMPETDMPDPNSVETPAYGFPETTIEAVVPRLPVPVGYWRSVGHSHTAFFEECFLDEVAHALGKDPLALRRALLQGQPRHLAVLRRLEQATGWGSRPPPAGRALGLALRASFGSVVGQVAEVSVNAGQIRVHRVTCAIDCGPVVNPAIVRAQMQGGIIFGLTAALCGEITLKGGAVEQRNFPDYPMLGLADAPDIDVHILDSESSEIGGAGEPGTPPIAPAVGNALFALTGTRLRSLPFRLP